MAAVNGHEALERASEREFAVVLLDVRMPALSGMDVIPRLQAEHPDTSVVMVTAVSDAETAVEAMRRGACDYLIKPFRLDEVLATVEKACARRRILGAQRRGEEGLQDQVSELTAQLEHRDKELRALNALIRTRLNDVFADEEAERSDNQD